MRKLLTLALILGLITGCSPAKPLAKLYALPEFNVVERSGKPMKKSDLLGKVWVANFFFSSCPSICKDLNTRMRALDKEFARIEEVRVVSITTDPENDTPEALRKYAESFGASDHWLFFTGKKGDLYQLCIDGFKLALQENIGAGDPIIHSGKMVLVDKTGMIRGYYDGVVDSSLTEGKTHLESEQKRLVSDIRTLLKSMP